MIYRALRGPLLRLLEVSPGPPEPPAGAHASVRVFRASPGFLGYRLLGISLGAVAVLVALAVAAVGAVAADESTAAVVVAVGAALVLLGFAIAYAGIRIDYEVRHYVFTDRSLRVREGAWVVREMTLSFANVQNLQVTQGPLQRLFGISDLRVHTAGGGGVAPGGKAGGGGSHTLTVAGVENATELRDLVGARVRRHPDAGLGDPDDEPSVAPRRAGQGPTAADLRIAPVLVEVRDAARALRVAAERRA